MAAGDAWAYSPQKVELAENMVFQEGLLQAWAQAELSRGREQILEEALPQFERVMIEAALAHTRGRKRDASILLGWGRNTLTRKMKALHLD